MAGILAAKYGRLVSFIGSMGALAIMTVISTVIGQVLGRHHRQHYPSTFASPFSFLISIRMSGKIYYVGISRCPFLFDARHPI
jgi:putative Ca2+/H+ antiporter (TMEM165/GDT1 family)